MLPMVRIRQRPFRQSLHLWINALLHCGADLQDMLGSTRVWRRAQRQVEEQRHGGHQEDQDDCREGAHGGEQLAHDGHTSTVRSQAVTGLGLR